MNVLDPAALSGFRDGHFAVSAEDDGVYLLTSGGAIPVSDERVLTTLDENQLTYIGPDWFTYNSDVGTTYIAAPDSPTTVGSNTFEGAVSGIFHGESESMFIGLGLGINSTQNLPATLRIVPNGATGAYVIAPHAMGAIAYELTYQNGGDTSTPGASIGAPFGGWRWTGTHQLDAVTDDPTDPVGTLHDDIGSVDSAIQANFGSSLFGGHYHGGIVLSASDVPDLTTERYVSSFNFGYEATITWPTGETATVSFDMAIQADGNLAGSMSYSSTAAFTKAFLSMVIATGFDQYSTDGGSSFDDGTGASTSLGSDTDVILRQGSTGYEIAVTTDQTGLSNVTNELISNGSRIKHYVRVTSAGGALGTVTMPRTIAFSKTDPDPIPTFDPITDTYDGSGSLPAGYSLIGSPGGTFSSTVTGGAWQLRAGAAPSGLQKHVRPIVGATLDGVTTYQLEIDYNSILSNTGAVLYISENDVGSTLSNLVTITGGSTSTSLNLSSNSATTATITFTLPEGSNPHVLIQTTGVANRGVNITEMRITEL